MPPAGVVGDATATVNGTTINDSNYVSMPYSKKRGPRWLDAASPAESAVRRSGLSGARQPNETRILGATTLSAAIDPLHIGTPILARMQREPWARARRNTAVLAAYMTVAVGYTFPLITRFTTYFPGGRDDKDVFGFIWNNWWTYHALTNLHVKPYLTDYIYYPHQLDLRLHTFGLLYGLLSLPAIPLLGPVGVLNAQILLTIVLNGYCCFRLSRYLTGDDAIGFISGLLVASVPAINFHLDVGRPSCAALWPAICVLFFGLRLLDGPTPRLAAALTAAIVATLLADQQITLFGALWLVVFAVYAVRERRAALVDSRFLRCCIAVVLISAVPAYLLYYRPLTRDLGYTVPGAIEAYNYSMRLGDLLDPRITWQIYGLVLPAGLLAGLLLLRRQPRLWPWVLGALAFVVLTLGPVIHGTRIPLPFALIRKLPSLEHFRTPYRFQIPAVLGMATATGLVIARLTERVHARRKAILGGCALVILADLVAHRLAYGFRLQTMPQEPLYARIAADPRDCLVLEVPLGVRTGTDRIGPGEELTFYQPVHRKRLVNGFAARVPLVALEYYRQSPALMFLAGATPPPGDLQADLRHRLSELRVGYVVVHPEMVASDRLPEILDLLRHTGELTPLNASQSLIAFQRNWPPDT
ncbi:MAG: hypothetical protein M3O46_11730 [Myxococcota bacterium]|nr:hypothetical protein [Myxococcota bacterium]